MLLLAAAKPEREQPRVVGIPVWIMVAQRPQKLKARGLPLSATLT